MGKSSLKNARDQLEKSGQQADAWAQKVHGF